MDKIFILILLKTKKCSLWLFDCIIINIYVPNFIFQVISNIFKSTQLSKTLFRNNYTQEAPLPNKVEKSKFILMKMYSISFKIYRENVLNVIAIDYQMIYLKTNVDSL